MSFKEFNLEISYKSIGEQTISDIINPLLKETKIYKRSVGYFSSSSLNFISDGILSLARNNGKIHLVTSPNLSQSDIDAINNGYLKREIHLKRFSEDFEETIKELNDENLELLSSLIEEGILDIKIVVKPNGGIYHDKLAILEDFNKNLLVFQGSNNETGHGYDVNYEKVRVYKSWYDLEGRIEDETNEFNSIWSDGNNYLDVYEFPDALKSVILEVRESNKIGNVNNKKKKNSFEYRPYQIEAKQNWIKNDHKGFFIMATGTGKTITSLYSIQELIKENQIFTVIAVPYMHLVTQWHEDVLKFIPNAIVHMVHGDIKDAEGKIYTSYLLSKAEYKPIIIITTMKSFYLPRFEKLYDKIKFEKLLIVDEAHNFVNKTTKELSLKYKYKLGLSATPVFGTDEDKTKLLLEWFGGTVMNLPIEKAIGTYLVNYMYHPIFIEATEHDEETFSKYHSMMLSAIDPIRNIIIDEEKFLFGYRGRLRAISMAEGKLAYIKSIFSQIDDRDHLIIYCSDGKLNYENKKVNITEEIRHLEYILKLINNSILDENSNLRATKFTATEKVNIRMELIDRFNKGYDDILVAIKCLDEGINIPSIKSALLLSSNDNYREFVQRRGRILRLYPNKDIAHIYDVVVMPSSSSRVFAEIELRRFLEYSKLAANYDLLQDVLLDKMSNYGLTMEDIKFKNEYANGGDLDE
ncbi:MAG: DEAD/DEAH box helicase family protein [bacterium]